MPIVCFIPVQGSVYPPSVTLIPLETTSSCVTLMVVWGIFFINPASRMRIISPLPFHNVDNRWMDETTGSFRSPE